MKKIVVLILLIAFCAGVGKGFHLLRDGFSAHRCYWVQGRSAPSSLGWDEETKRCALQCFHYLGRGRQCFAFESEDGKYVIKIPRTDGLNLPFWVRSLPCQSYREKVRAVRAARKQKLELSLCMSYEELREQTGVVAIHFPQTASEGDVLTLKCWMGCVCHLALDNTAFILQRKHPIWNEVFLAAVCKGDRREAEKILEALFAVVKERAALGIISKDEFFLGNYGFDGEKAFVIDLGDFTRSKETVLETSIHETMRPVRAWLDRVDPSILPFFDAMCDFSEKRSLS